MSELFVLRIVWDRAWRFCCSADFAIVFAVVSAADFAKV